MAIETNYNIHFIAALALREKQIQQNYRPIIGVHKWFARRPGTLFRGLLLSEFGGRPVEEIYYKANALPGLTIADPFMGGGTPLLEANRLGCDVIGLDINPMAAWIVREEVDALDLPTYAMAATRLTNQVREKIGHLYKTRCTVTGSTDSDVKYFLWVKIGTCDSCLKDYDLFPSYVVAEDSRHTSYVLVCPECGDLNEVANPDQAGTCNCGGHLAARGPVRRNKCACPHCGHVNTAPFHRDGPPRHRLFAIEYYNPSLKDRPGRLFKKPDAVDLEGFAEAEVRWSQLKPLFVPNDAIPAGDESSRLHRWGYQRFAELFNARQLLALEVSARIIAELGDERIRRALATNFSDLLRYQNMLCRYDTWALKSLDVFSIHGFPVSYVQVESNILGIRNSNSLPVGSGGWVNIIDKYSKAKRYCTEPFEVAIQGKKRVVLPIRGEWIGKHNPDDPATAPRAIDIRCMSSTKVELPQASLDGVFTDPPYYGNVQYGELMEFCYVWLRKLMGKEFRGLEHQSTRHSDDVTGNETADRDLAHFTERLGTVYKLMARALKPGAPLVFTYHHNKQKAYCAAGVAILDAGLSCSASLPCPAEMGGSIHIHGTGSSIVDTVFVCRDTDKTPQEWLFENNDGLASLITRELAALRAAGMKPTDGDVRCIAWGHLTRMAIWKLRASWQRSSPTDAKLQLFMHTMDGLGRLDDLRARLGKEHIDTPAESVIMPTELAESIDADAV